MAVAEAELAPTGSLYGRMMKAIHISHEFGNKVRLLKLPLIFLEDRLYAGAIAQFFWSAGFIFDFS